MCMPPSLSLSFTLSLCHRFVCKLLRNFICSSQSFRNMRSMTSATLSSSDVKWKTQVKSNHTQNQLNNKEQQQLPRYNLHNVAKGNATSNNTHAHVRKGSKLQQRERRGEGRDEGREEGRCDQLGPSIDWGLGRFKHFTFSCRFHCSRPLLIFGKRTHTYTHTHTNCARNSKTEWVSRQVSEWVQARGLA